MASTTFAAQLGVLTYTSDGSSISITRCQTTATAAVVVPNEIEGLPVTSIADSAFTDCKTVTAVTLPPTVTELGINAFEQCVNMTAINIPSGVGKIGYDCFSGCSRLVSVSLPASVTDLGIRIFRGCSSLQTALLPANLIAIPDGMFLSCTSLVNLTIPAGVQTIDTNAFSGCSSLANLEIPNGVQQLNPSSFNGCGLTSILIPQSVKLISYSAFANCRSLASVTIQANGVNIYTSAFRNCVALSTLNLPFTPGFMSDRLVEDCTSLTHLQIPAGWTNIGTGVFAGCSNLRSATFLGSAPSLGIYPFQNSAPDFVILYQPGAVGFTSPVWSGYPAFPLTPGIEIRQSGDPAAMEIGSLRNFGNITLGKSVAIDFEITNAGHDTLDPLTVSYLGANPSDFLLTALAKSALEPGESMALHVVFNPTAVGERSAMLRIVSNDAERSPFDILLTGRATPVPKPEIEIRQPTGSNLIDGKSKRGFGAVEIGRKSIAKTFTIKNGGNAWLSELVVVMGGPNSKDFVVSGWERTSLKPSGSATFSVRFKPTALGSRAAIIRVKSNDMDESTFDIKLSGSGKISTN